MVEGILKDHYEFGDVIELEENLPSDTRQGDTITVNGRKCYVSMLDDNNLSLFYRDSSGEDILHLSVSYPDKDNRHSLSVYVFTKVPKGNTNHPQIKSIIRKLDL